MRSFRGVVRLLALACSCFAPTLSAQNAATVVNGSVLDPSGAAIPHASVHLHSGTNDRNTLADDRGFFTFTAQPGTYELTVTAAGFRGYTRSNFIVSPARNVALNITLPIATDTEEVNVTGEEGLSTDASANKGALIFKDKEMDTFSDDPTVMQQQLQALGGSDPTNPPQIYVDGFSNGTLPPKESIREIRINQNPFSAVYDQFGQGRIEIFTKPGTNQFHGNIDAFIGNKALNTGNPYVGAQPSYNQDFIYGSFSGPIGKKSAFFFTMQRREQNTNAVINAVTGVTSGGQNIAFTQAVPTPTLNQTFNFRFDRQITANDTFIARYIFADSSLTNAGIGQLILADQGFASTTHTQTLQLSDSHIFSPKVIFDSNFQYIRTRLRQDPNSTAPSVTVQGAFASGGNSAQALHDNQDRIEFQEYFSVAQGAHFLRTGLRYRLLREANLSTAGYRGQFDFPSLAAYTANTPSQYSITAGTPNVALMTGDLGVFVDDEWKYTPNLTLNYGIRIESQTAIPDHFDFGPRVGFAYSWKRTPKAKEPFLVVRGGFGLFYTRFPATNILQSLRQNGVSQKTYVLVDPKFSLNNTPDISTFTATQPTVFEVSPHLRSPMQMQGLLSAEHAFGKYGSMTAQYFQRRTTHQLESLNINAPLPGTYDPANPASGVRPLGGTQSVYQYASDGISNGRVFTLGFNLNAGEKFSMFLFSAFAHQESDTAVNFGGGGGSGGGGSSFVSNSYNVHQDYGRLANFPARQVYTGINATPFRDLRVNVFLGAQSGSPFNITIGKDINGDTQYNDRPAFATDLSRPSVVRTLYGDFDTAPLPGQTVIPKNYATGPMVLYTEFNLNKTFHFGPRVPPPPTPAGNSGTPAPAAAAAPGKAPPPPPQRYSIRLGTEIDNPLNFVNPGNPVGVLSSPLFGRSLSLNNNFIGTSSANRVITFRVGFAF